jgi:hypothetical protein
VAGRGRASRHGPAPRPAGPTGGAGRGSSPSRRTCRPPPGRSASRWPDRPPSRCGTRVGGWGCCGSPAPRCRRPARPAAARRSCGGARGGCRAASARSAPAACLPRPRRARPGPSARSPARDRCHPAGPGHSPRTARRDRSSARSGPCPAGRCGSRPSRPGTRRSREHPSAGAPRWPPPRGCVGTGRSATSTGPACTPCSGCRPARSGRPRRPAGRPPGCAPRRPRCTRGCRSAADRW